MLSAAKLKREILALGHPKDVQSAARAWAKAYVAYASDATSPAGGDVSTFAIAESLLARSLVGVFKSGSATAAAQGLATALTIFWLTPPVVFTASTPGAVSAVTGTAVLAAGLPAVWNSAVVTKCSSDQAVGRMVTLLDTFTKTVVVTHPPPLSVSGPIT